MQKRLIHHLLLFLALIFGSGAAAHPLAEPQANGVLVTHPLHLLQCKSFEQVGLVEVAAEPDKLDSIEYPGRYSEVYQYDSSSGRLIAQERRDLQGNVLRSVSFGFDTAGRVNSLSRKDGTKLSFVRDAGGRITSQKLAAPDQPEQTLFQVEYGAFNQPIAHTNARGQRQEMTWDASGRLASLRSPEGRTTTFSYEIRPGTNGAAGHLVVTSTQPRGNRHSAFFDGKGRPIRVENFAPGASQPESTYESVYDEQGRITFIKNGLDDSVLASMSYNADGQILSQTVSHNSFSLTSTAEYSKNQLSAWTGPDGIRYSVAYDQAGLPATIGIPGLDAISVTGWNQAHPTGLRFPGGSTLSWTHDAFDQLTAIDAKDPAGNSLLSRQFHYDDIGNLASLDTEAGQTNYQYDLKKRLVGLQEPGHSQEFTLDATGNRLAHKIDGQNLPGDWLYDRDDQLSASPGCSYLYDANGNLTQMSRDGIDYTYEYNASDRLIAVRKNGSLAATCSYDCFGNRISKNSGGNLVHYHYGLDHQLQGEYSPTGAPIKTYGWSDGEPLFVRFHQAEGSIPAGQYAFFINDERGTPLKAFTPAGQVIWSAKYDVFGKAEVNGPAEINLRLPGQYFDAETGLHYNGFRYYDPVTGRYTQVDPIRDRDNYYAYASANPVANIDPLGLKTVGAFSEAAFDITLNTLIFSCQVINTGEDILLGCIPVLGTGNEAWKAVIAYFYGNQEEYDSRMTSMYISGALDILILEGPGVIGKPVQATIQIKKALIGLKGMYGVFKTLSIGSFKTILNGIRAAAAAVKCKITGKGCFSAGHQVITKERGLVAIETVRQGEHVLSRDEQGKEYYAEVTDAFTRHDSFLCELRYRLPSGEERMNSVTPEHPYSRDGKEWIGAKDLKAGDRIALKQGFATVVGLRTFATPNDGTFTVFNITVNDAHSYFVLPPGKTGIEEAVWVHNSIHHLCTNKNFLSFARGGPWSPSFKVLFDKAGLRLNGWYNKVFVAGHKGPHPEIYHTTILNRLSNAVKNLTPNTAAYTQALLDELAILRKEAATAGTLLNDMLTNPSIYY